MITITNREASKTSEMKRNSVGDCISIVVPGSSGSVETRFVIRHIACSRAKQTRNDVNGNGVRSSTTETRILGRNGPGPLFQVGIG